jgi:hypothetical protein
VKHGSNQEQSGLEKSLNEKKQQTIRTMSELSENVQATPQSLKEYTHATSFRSMNTGYATRATHATTMEEGKGPA